MFLLASPPALPASPFYHSYLTLAGVGGLILELLAGIDYNKAKERADNYEQKDKEYQEK
jgi:hypothetical protein